MQHCSTLRLSPFCLILLLEYEDIHHLCGFLKNWEIFFFPIFSEGIFFKLRAFMFVPFCTFCQAQLANFSFKYQMRKLLADSVLAVIWCGWGLDQLWSEFICKQSEKTSFKQPRVWLFGSHQRSQTAFKTTQTNFKFVQNLFKVQSSVQPDSTRFV